MGGLGISSFPEEPNKRLPSALAFVQQRIPRSTAQTVASSNIFPVSFHTKRLKTMDWSKKPIDEVVEEIMRVHRCLPARPGIDEVEVAKTLIRNVEKEEQIRLEAIARQTKSSQAPEELFNIFQEMKRNLIHFQSNEEKREAQKLLVLENLHLRFDDLILRASNCLPSTSSSSSISNSGYGGASTSSSGSSSVSLINSASLSGGCLSSPKTSSSSMNFERELVKTAELFTRDDSYVKKSNSTFHADGIGIGFGVGLRSKDVSAPRNLDSSLTPLTALSQDSQKLSLIKLASLIEVSSKKGTRDLNLQNKFTEQIEWLPDSIGKLSSLVTLDLSENRILALPNSTGGLSLLMKLDLHANRIGELPASIGNLLSLVYLDLRGNQLAFLPMTIGRLVHLEELDLSSNMLSVLPESIGSLVCLKKLNVETNNIEEIPHTIGQCSSLRELHAEYNRLKALPEAVGQISSLEILSVRYNNIHQLPTTMASLSILRELDVSFNQLEAVPESLCFATTLVKMNISNNFADLQFLPRSIGNLEMLEELDMSNNQIRVLPDSFRMLTRLLVLRVEGNPLEVPPGDIIEKGAQAVVLYMDELVAKREAKMQPVKQKKSWAQRFFFSTSNKRKRGGTEWAKA